jgi:hypothetical protein
MPTYAKGGKEGVIRKATRQDKSKRKEERTRAKERKGKTENNNVSGTVAQMLFLGSKKPCV